MSPKTSTNSTNKKTKSKDPSIPEINNVPEATSSSSGKNTSVQPISSDSSQSSKSTATNPSLNLALPKADTADEIRDFIEKAIPALDKAGYKPRDNYTLVKLVDKSYKSELHKHVKFLHNILEKNTQILDTLMSNTHGLSQAEKLQCMNMESAQLKGRHIKTSSDMDFLIENLLIQAETRTGWSDALVIKLYTNTVLTSTLNLIADQTEITETMVLNNDFKATSELQIACTTMYQCLSQSCHKDLIDKVSIHKNKYGTVGPKFLFYILQELRRGNSDIIEDAENYSKEFCTKANTNLKAFENMIGTMINKLQRLRTTKNDGTKIIETIVTGLHNVQNHAFQHKLTLSLNKIGTSTIDQTIALLQEISTNISSLKKLKSWSTDSPQTEQDLTALNASKLKRAPQSQNGTQNKRRRGNPTAPKPSSATPLPFIRYAARFHIGEDKHYQTKQEFTTFVSGAWGKDTVIMNGINWYWCEKCNRMGSHTSTLHEKAYKGQSMKPKKKGPPKPDSSTLLAHNATLGFDDYPSETESQAEEVAAPNLDLAESFDADAPQE